MSNEINHNNNNDDEEEEENANNFLAIESEEDYIRSRGILHHDPNEEETRIDDVEAAERQAQVDAYQHALHTSIFGLDENDDERRKKKVELLDKLDGLILTVLLASSAAAADGGDEDDAVKQQQQQSVPLAPFAKSCDTVYGLAINTVNPHFTNKNSATEEKEESCIQLDLTQFHPSAVMEFLSIITTTYTTTNTNATLSTIIEKVVSDEQIVECCRIAHFLQCNYLVQELATIMESSIDSTNCLSICHFADQLNLHSLFEKSLSHMLSTMENMQNHDLWVDFPKELQSRILTMRNAIQSSIIGKGQRAKVFFSSSDEFLAIFSDNIREQRERLREAKRRQEEVIQERVARESRGFLRSRGDGVRGGSVRDAEIKIEKQERRIRTLESFYEEQKKIFAEKGVWRDHFESEDHGLVL
mmetsp:Transcript_27420/g.41073  ORF Transcript_27420/g.41073 Transcript_27420/m.41073 type:complete len:416 (-) Transcript_27420:159-1406(-)